MNSFQEKVSRKDAHTDGWTEGQTRLLRSQRPVGRETKKPSGKILQICDNIRKNFHQKPPPSKKKERKTSIFGNFRPKGPFDSFLERLEHFSHAYKP